MRNFIILFVLTTVLCLYLARKSYIQMDDALNAKEIHEKMVKDRFWETQKSFEE
jgi:hypothetical protein